MTRPLPLPDENNLLPLRIAGFNYRCDREMAELVRAGLTVGDPIWSHFPQIQAGRSSRLKIRNDACVSPNYLGLRQRSVTDGDPREAKVRNRWMRQDSFEELYADLLQFFSSASSRFAGARFLTPAELICSVVEDANLEVDLPVPPMTEIDGFLKIDLRTTASDVCGRVMSLLFMMRELYYHSKHFTKSDRRSIRNISLCGSSYTRDLSPVPYSAEDPPMDLGLSFDPALRFVRLHEPMHCLAVGASGVGKTFSIVVPRIRAHLAYELKDGTRSAALIVDPKRELAHITERFLTERGDRNRLFLAGRDGRLRLFSKNSTLSLYDRVSLVCNEFGLNPAHCGDSGPWIKKSLALLWGLIESHAIFYNATGFNLFYELMHSAGRKCSTNANYWHQVRDVIKLLQEGIESTRWMHQRLSALASKLSIRAQQRGAFHFLARYASMDSEGANQIAYVTGHLDAALSSLCDAGISNWLDLSPAPEAQGSHDTSFDIQNLIDDSRVIVFQPNDSPSGDVGTRLLKSQFYRAALQRKNFRQPVLFLCDEFQRFITCDRESGEASLLDRCRAYRVTAVLATQSVTALYDSLAKRGDTGNALHAVNSILANVGHVFYFQTFDEVSTASLRRACPAQVPPGWKHPLEVLPLSALRVGEAYYVAPQGRWGRAQFKPN